MKLVNKMIFAAKIKLEDMMENEQGDTNFISIIIILGIVIGLAIIFRGYIAGIVSKIGDQVTKFTSGL